MYKLMIILNEIVANSRKCSFLVLACSLLHVCCLSCSAPCPENGFMCDGGLCISSLQYCDGYSDCLDGSDEPIACGMSMRNFIFIMFGYVIWQNIYVLRWKSAMIWVNSLASHSECLGQLFYCDSAIFIETRFWFLCFICLIYLVCSYPL